MSGRPRVAVVTGAGQGLGQAIARAFDRAGFAVALLGRTQAKLEATAALLNGPSLSVPLDLADPDQVRSAFARVADALGSVDVLINNAAIYGPFSFDAAADAEIEDMVRQTLLAPISCIRAAIPFMRRAGAGDIVTISSQSVETPQPMMLIYSGAKAALEVITKGLRNEYKGEPIRFITVQPGVIASAADGAWSPNADAYLAAIGKAGMEHTFVYPGARPESIAATVVHAVTAPRDIYLQTVDVRGTDADERPTVPPG